MQGCEFDTTPGATERWLAKMDREDAEDRQRSKAERKALKASRASAPKSARNAQMMPDESCGPVVDLATRLPGWTSPVNGEFPEASVRWLIVATATRNVGAVWGSTKAFCKAVVKDPARLDRVVREVMDEAEAHEAGWQAMVEAAGG